MNATTYKAHTAPNQGLLANLRVIEAIAENITDSEARSVILQMVKASFDRANEANLRRAQLVTCLENAADQFDFTVSAMTRGQKVSVSSLQNCAANCRAIARV